MGLTSQWQSLDVHAGGGGDAVQLEVELVPVKTLMWNPSHAGWQESWLGLLKWAVPSAPKLSVTPNPQTCHEAAAVLTIMPSPASERQFQQRLSEHGCPTSTPIREGKILPPSGVVQSPTSPSQSGQYHEGTEERPLPLSTAITRLSGELRLVLTPASRDDPLASVSGMQLLAPVCEFERHVCAW